MSKSSSQPCDDDAKTRATQKLARGHVTPAQAAKMRHRSDVVLGEVDSAYHDGSPKGRK